MIKAYETESVTLHKATLGSWQERTEVDSTIEAVVFPETKLIKNEAGEDVMSSMKLLTEVTNVSHSDRITVSGKKYAILRLLTIKAFGSVSHLEIYL